jgi:hypothetical protein
MKQGKGKFRWQDGSTYEGEFRENNLHGIDSNGLEARESTLGQMGDSTLANGPITRCMEMDTSSGQMARSTGEGTWRIRRMAMESLPGLMVRCTRASGRTESSMGKDRWCRRMEQSCREFGREESFRIVDLCIFISIYHYYGRI